MFVPDSEAIAALYPPYLYRPHGDAAMLRDAGRIAAGFSLLADLSAQSDKMLDLAAANPPQNLGACFVAIRDLAGQLTRIDEGLAHLRPFDHLNAVTQYGQRAQVLLRAAQGVQDRVERGDTSSDEAMARLRGYLAETRSLVELGTVAGYHDLMETGHESSSDAVLVGKVIPETVLGFDEVLWSLTRRSEDFGLADRSTLMRSCESLFSKVSRAEQDPDALASLQADLRTLNAAVRDAELRDLKQAGGPELLPPQAPVNRAERDEAIAGRYDKALRVVAELEGTQADRRST